MAAEGRSAYFGNFQRENQRTTERIYRNAHLRSDDSREDCEKRHSLSPVSVITVSSNSKYPSVSPPKLVDGKIQKDTYETSMSSSNIKNSNPRSSTSSHEQTRDMLLSRNFASKLQSRDRLPPKRLQSRSRSQSLPKRYRQKSRSPYKYTKKRRSRSRSRSGRHRRSRSRSQSRSGRHQRSRSRSQSRSGRHRRSRSRSQSRSGRHQRSRSRGRQVRSHRSRSPGRPTKSRRSRSKSESPYSKSSARHWSKSRSRSREPAKMRHRSRSSSSRSKHSSYKRVDEKSVWEAFQVQMDDLEEKWEEERKLYDKNPESHPDYKMEWKKFYKGRVQELLERGDNPKLHNFESDWAYFWKFRMDELLKLDYERKKVATKRRLNLPDDAEMPEYLQVRETGETNIDKRMLSSRGGGTISRGLISTLRIATAVEEQLGSLGPRVNGLLAKAVTLQRITGSHPDSLLSDQENLILLETVKEKLLGQIQSKIVKKSLEAAVEEAIISITAIVNSVPSSYPTPFEGQVNALGDNLVTHNSVTSNVVNVFGVGQVDRVAIAQQIADALIKQGKTDVTEAELQELVNGVVGMVEAQGIAERGIQSEAVREIPETIELVIDGVVEAVPEDKGSVQDMQLVSSSSMILNPAKVPQPVLLPTTVEETKSAKPPPKENEAFNMLMSVVTSGIKKSDSFEKSQNWSSDDSDEPCNSKIFQKKSNPEKISSNGSDKVCALAEQSLVVNPDLKVSVEVTNSNATPEEGNSSIFGKKGGQKWYHRINRSPSPEIFKALKQKSMLAGKQEIARSGVNARKWSKDLSPFSSREETSNPLAASEEEDEDLKVIGAWDSDSDIDLDSSGKTKVPAYDKINVRKPSPVKCERNASQLTKVKHVTQSTTVRSPHSISSDLNLDAAIDNLMGELKNKTSKIEVISGKQSNVAVKTQMTNPIKSITDMQPSNHGQYFPLQSQQSVAPANVPNQGYNVAYSYPQQGLYGGLQQGYYYGGSVANYNQYGGQPYNYTGGQVAAQPYFNAGGGTVMYGPNIQWQNYYGQPQASFPSTQGSNTNYGKL